MCSIELEQNGKHYQANYFVDENVVTVHGDSGQESTQLGRMSEQQVAKMLLRVLIKKGHIASISNADA